MATKALKQPRLTLHQLLAALSFWGSTTRLLLVGFIIAVIFGLKLLYLNTTVVWETQVFIYVLGSIALLDIGYVILARSLPLLRRFDQLALFISEIFLVLIYVLPNLIAVPSLSRLAGWSVLIVLLIIGTRALLGLLFTKK